MGVLPPSRFSVFHGYVVVIFECYIIILHKCLIIRMGVHVISMFAFRSLEALNNEDTSGRGTLWGTSKCTLTLHFIIMWKCEIPIISLENTWISYNNWNNLSKEKDTRSNPTTCTCIYVTLKYHHINAPYVSILNMEKRTIKSLEFLLTFKTLKHWNVRTLNVIIIFIPITMLFGTDNIMRNNFPYSN